MWLKKENELKGFSMKFALTGGGTGGHLSIAKALAIELEKQGIEAIYLGSTYGQDREWFENSPLFSERYFFNTQGVVNKSFFKKIGSLFLQAKAAFKAKEILKNTRSRTPLAWEGLAQGRRVLQVCLIKYPFISMSKMRLKALLTAIFPPKLRRCFQAMRLKIRAIMF